jgi:hypothetical protein
MSGGLRAAMKDHSTELRMALAVEKREFPPMEFEERIWQLRGPSGESGVFESDCGQTRLVLPLQQTVRRADGVTISVMVRGPRIADRGRPQNSRKQQVLVSSKTGRKPMVVATEHRIGKTLKTGRKPEVNRWKRESHGSGDGPPAKELFENSRALPTDGPRFLLGSLQEEISHQSDLRKAVHTQGITSGQSGFASYAPAVWVNPLPDQQGFPSNGLRLCENTTAAGCIDDCGVSKRAVALCNSSFRS